MFNIFRTLLMFKLKKYKLGELIDVCRGTSLSGEYYATEGDLIRLTLGNFDYQGGGFKDNTSKNDLYFTGLVKPEFILSEGDIITPLTEQTPGLLGSTAMIPESGKYIQSQDVALVTPDESKLDRNFCYYLLPSKIVKQQLAAGAQQTKIRHTTPDRIKDLTVFIPDLANQKAIGQLLHDIDKKIALNREINRNLEAMARQLYDYWFVQFDFPDENGRPYKSSGGKMVWNEKLKREIPEGWMSKMIRDMSEIQRESCTPNVSLDTIYHLFSIPAFDKTGAYVLESGTEIQSDKFVITKDDILISKLNPWTSRVVWCGDYPNQIASTEFVVLRPRIEDRGYLYMALKDPKLIAYASKGATGTSNSHKRVNPEFLTAYRIPYEPSVVRKFSESINSIQNQLLKNRNEINILITQREELLPLLINGQVSVMPTAVNCDLSHD